MKKLILLTVVISLFLMGCDGILSVVTVNKNGEKVVHNYISMMGDTVYDETVSLKNWQDMEQIKDNEFMSGSLLFTIVNKKENIVVLGTEAYAMEIKFFDGGYKCTGFISAEGLSEAFN